MKNLDALTTFIVLPSQTRSGLFCSRGRATSSRKGEGEASILRLNPLLSSFSLDSFRGLAGGVACMIPACRMRLTENGSMAVKAQGGYWLTMCGRFQPPLPAWLRAGGLDGALDATSKGLAADRTSGSARTNPSGEGGYR